MNYNSYVVLIIYSIKIYSVLVNQFLANNYKEVLCKMQTYYEFDSGCCCMPESTITREERLENLRAYREALQNEASEIDKEITELQRQN